MSLRTSLKSLISRDPAAPSLSDRLAAGRAKIADVKRRATIGTKMGHIAFNALKPEPAPEPLNRVLLVNYATWLWHERRRVSGELYPHLGTKADAFVLGLNAAENWHFKGADRSGGWAQKPPATPRAVQILDMVGVDWRADEERGGLSHVDTSNLQDTGERPVLPYGWPAPDAALLEALDDLVRLDAAQNAMFAPDSDRPGDKVPGYGALEDARDEALERLAATKAESLIGLQAKAKVLLTRSVVDAGNHFTDIAEGLARDLIGGSQAIIEPKADPIFAAINECRRLVAAVEAAEQVPQPAGRLDALPEQREAFDGLNRHVDDVVLQTVPTTARGCAALARYAAEFSATRGFEIDEDEHGTAHLRILGLIARSPLL
ncbi:hypothetical protein R1A27_34525 (plasmid) [Methylobacterium sp. NMS12]|uniref:hypothetical protein n=1 Tax=Methylobacterium sp. NMS12 TaxID=3079766 RepID=UPI003F88124A